ncbi:methyltransferase domain-containing protein [Croceiramulus getboli]|nr:methyltransferase domain-containing protein [Flavobacteriaceae bacterium YJPT1-3]
MKTNEAYWSQRYQAESTPWDIGYASPPLTEYIDQLPHKDLNILIPGAGLGHEAAYLWQQGFHKLTVIDIAEEPLKRLQAQHPELPSSCLKHEDFFSHEGQYELILEQTFFCALEPSFRESYVKHMHRLLAPGGRLAGLFFDFPLTESGPPFGGSKAEYQERFSPYFELLTLEPCTNSIPPRQGKELFFIFEKKPS